MSKNLKIAVIAAAGEGKRCFPISTIFPKEMFPVHNKPVIHYLIEEAIVLGAKQIIIVISNIKSSIKEYVKMFFHNIDISFIVQAKPLGLLNLIRILPLEKDEKWCLMLGDELLVINKKNAKEILDAFTNSTNLVLVQKVAKENISNYGMVSFDKNFNIINYIEKPIKAKKELTHAIIGRYYFDMSQMDINFLKTENNLTKLLDMLIKKNKLQAFEFHDKRFDVSTAKGLSEANIK